MQLKDIKIFLGGLNKDDDPIKLPEGDYVDGFNIRTGSSTSQHEVGHVETLQSEIEILLGVDAEITYYGGAIGGEFIYSGFEEVQIGTQVWLKKNYDVDYPGSKVYNNDEVNRDIYGGLYTWNQVMASDFCPPGWHVPTEAEVNTLLTYLGGALVAGGKMKEPDDLHWLTPNTGADDSSGFKGLPGGQLNAIFSLLGEQGLFWIAGDGYPWAPVALPATDITPLTFMANWEASDGADGYWLDISTDPLFGSFLPGYDNKDVGNVLQDTVGGLVPLLNYYYRVRANNDIDTSDNSNIITVKTIAIPLPLLDKDGNIYTTVTIGTQEWIVQNLKTTHYADGTAIPNITVAEYNDWFLPSKDELTEIYNVLTLFGIGVPASNFRWSSSEINAATAHYLDFNTGLWGVGNKIGDDITIRAIRTFTSMVNYNLRDIGPAGGRIFWKSGNDYLECAPTDKTPPPVYNRWSNIALIAGTGTIIGTGQTNTLTIVGQPGHIYSAAKDCDDLSVSGWVNDTVGAYCWYNNNIVNKTLYGALYNWYAINNAHILEYLERGGVQESGWRVPTASDWATLISHFGGSLVAGGKLKEIGTVHWNAPNLGAIDEVGFKTVPAGYRNGVNGSFNAQGDSTIFGSDSMLINDGLIVQSANASLLAFGVISNDGISIRLVRDASSGKSFDSTLITFDSTVETFDGT